MTTFQLCDREEIETARVFDLPGGAVTVIERETHEFYRHGVPQTTRLVIGNAIDRTKDFVSKARFEFAELYSVLRELSPR